MVASLPALMEKLGDNDLPILAATATELGKLAVRGERAPLNDIADIVLHDPFCTLNVLRAMGTRKQGRLASEITTIQHALIMFGARPFFESFAKPKIVEEQLAANPKALMQLRRAFSRAHHAACQAQDWANYHQDIESEEVYIASSLQEIGEALLCLLAPHMAEQMTQAMHRNPSATQQEQRKIIGFDVLNLQGTVFQAFRLPDVLLGLMQAAETNNRRAQSVRLAAAMARQSESGWHGTAMESALNDIAEHLRCPLDEAVSHVHRTAALAARAWRWYGVFPAARWLPLIPTALNAPHARVIHAPASFASVSAAIEWGVQVLAQQVNLQRVMFALRSPDGKCMRAQYYLGAAGASSLVGSQIGLGHRHLFDRLLSKQQTVWLNAHNQTSLLPYVTEEITRTIGQGEFFAASVFLSGQPLGMIYADQRGGGQQLQDDAYKQFKQVLAAIHAALVQRQQRKTVAS